MIGADVVKGILTQGEEQFGKLAANLISNPAFVSALQKAVTSAVQAKGLVDGAISNALQGAHVPTTADMQKLNDRLEELERIFESLSEKVDRIATTLETKPAAPKPVEPAPVVPKPADPK